MNDVRPLPGVFTDERHLVANDAPAHGSAHLGRRYRALCRALCLPAPTGPFTWCGWPICANPCAKALLHKAFASG